MTIQSEIETIYKPRKQSLNAIHNTHQQWVTAGLPKLQAFKTQFPNMTLDQIPNLGVKQNLKALAAASKQIGNRDRYLLWYSVQKGLVPSDPKHFSKIMKAIKIPEVLLKTQAEVMGQKATNNPAYVESSGSGSVMQKQGNLITKIINHATTLKIDPFFLDPAEILNVSY